MFADKPWLQIVVFFVVAVPVVAIVTRLVIWLVYCFKAAPDRSGSEEMALADWTSKLKEGVKPYASYEEWRQDVRSNKPLDEILGRVPPGFFDKKQEPESKQGPQGAQSCQGPIGPQGPQGAQAADISIARQRLAEIQKRIKGETNQASKRQLEQFRQHLVAPPGVTSGGGWWEPSPRPSGDGVVVTPWMPDVARSYCQHCSGTGYVTRPNVNGIPTSGIPCAWCQVIK